MQPDLVHVRDGQPADTALLVQWMQAMAWETERKRLDPPRVLAGVGGVFARPARGRYLLAECAGVAAGMLLLTHEWSDWRNGNWWWIQSVYVAPQFRRRGVFRALYAQVRAQAQATPGVCGLRLYVEKDNTAAQRTYAMLGMGEAGYRVLEEEFGG